MNSPRAEAPGDRPSDTLGSVLYANSAEPLVSEADWVDLVHAIAGHSEVALKELYGRTHGFTFTLIFRIVKDPLTAEEVLLDVYHDVWRNAATFDVTRGTVVAWLMNQARSRAIDRLRTENRKKRSQSYEPTLVVETIPSSAQEQRNALEQCLQGLTPDERRAIETAYFQELTYAEVAQRLGEPLGTIKTRIRTGLARLRTLLASKEGL
ncbi:MAG TPA: sigma-70 family RNA polymerase sigma factor [Gammaproteobacteria bacterium]|nr:sigma-70 family RNA polymerase sigma factor [Gammaproteobacteria bacterium]